MGCVYFFSPGSKGGHISVSSRPARAIERDLVSEKWREEVEDKTIKIPVKHICQNMKYNPLFLVLDIIAKASN